ncbi:MAG: MOSC domain-containing protein [Alphaproteobacteria bacterium]|nr:MOSC domain-containing protein [Alphaproteobacteria bacterium]
MRILSVNVARPQLLAVMNGEEIFSGIAKKPVAANSLFVRRENIEGDGQADLSVHGGLEKAVYAYPAGHWAWWQREHKLDCGPATFGENLTLDCEDETTFAIGDRFQWGDAVIEVCQPRAPCFKLALHTMREDIPARMTQSARCGIYFRVVAEGAAPVSGAELVRTQQGSGPDIREAFVSGMHPGVPADVRERTLAAPALAKAWRRIVNRWLEPG